MRHWLAEHRTTAITAAVGVAALVAVVLVWFQPQKVFIDTVIDETIPGDVAAQASTETASTTTTPTSEAPAQTPDDATPTTQPQPPATTVPPSSEPLVLSDSDLVGVAHEGSGRALILELETGEQLVRFEDLDVSNGPDLLVILSPSPVIDRQDTYADGDFLDLGPLKGNQGNQNYEIPGGTDLTQYGSIVIWCRRFNTTFNAAVIELN